MSNDKKEAGLLILKDLAMFNEATILFEKEIQPEIQEKFNECIENWTKQKGWIFEINDKNWDINDPANWLSVSPKKWCPDTDSNFWFYLGWLQQKSDSYLLADLTGIGSDDIIFGFDMSNYKVCKNWKTILKTLENENINRLNERGFVFDTHCVFTLPIKKLELKKLVIAWETDNDCDYEEAFKPLTDALDTLETSWQIFDELIDKVKDDL